MELFDIETQTQVYKQGVYLADAVTQNGSPQAMVDAVHAVTKSYILKNKFVTIFWWRALHIYRDHKSI